MGIAIATATGECWVLLDAVSGAIFLDSEKIIADLVSSKYGVGKRIHFGELDGTHACIDTQKCLYIHTFNCAGVWFYFFLHFLTATPNLILELLNIYVDV